MVADENKSTKNNEKQWLTNVMTKLIEMDRTYADLMTKYQEQIWA